MNLQPVHPANPVTPSSGWTTSDEKCECHIWIEYLYRDGKVIARRCSKCDWLHGSVRDIAGKCPNY